MMKPSTCTIGFLALAMLSSQALKAENCIHRSATDAQPDQVGMLGDVNRNEATPPVFLSRNPTGIQSTLVGRCEAEFWGHTLTSKFWEMGIDKYTAYECL